MAGRGTEGDTKLCMKIKVSSLRYSLPPLHGVSVDCLYTLFMFVQWRCLHKHPPSVTWYDTSQEIEHHEQIIASRKGGIYFEHIIEVETVQTKRDKDLKNYKRDWMTHKDIYNYYHKYTDAMKQSRTHAHAHRHTLRDCDRYSSATWSSFSEDGLKVWYHEVTDAVLNWHERGHLNGVCFGPHDGGAEHDGEVCRLHLVHGSILHHPVARGERKSISDTHNHSWVMLSTIMWPSCTIYHLLYKL